MEIRILHQGGDVIGDYVAGGVNDFWALPYLRYAGALTTYARLFVRELPSEEEEC